MLLNWLRNNFEISHAKHKSLASMEGIRGFAVFLVFLVHYTTLINPWLVVNSNTYEIAESIRRIGNIGVDLFFVLSGFLIYGMLIKKHKPFAPYLLRRIQRIYPTFTVVLVLYLILSALFPSASKLPKEWGDAIFLIFQNFLLLPGLFDITAIVTVAWSLSYELFYYLFIPLLILLTAMRRWNPVLRVTFFGLGSILLFIYFVNYGGPMRLLMFVPGIILYEFIQNNWLKNFPPVGLPALIIAIVFVSIQASMNIPAWSIYIVLYILFFIFCLECFSSSGTTTQLFSYSPIRWLGNMSYSYYLIHGLSLKFCFLILEKVHPAQQTDNGIFWMLLPIMFCISLIPSAILFIYIEKPFSLAQKNN
jgi:peptidoglycan/LPS O-acetylase OafA/YrhL